MPKVDPKFAFWFGVWTTFLMFLASFGIDHAPSYIAQYAPDVQWFANFFAKSNTVILTCFAGLSSSQFGPLVGSNPPSGIPPMIVRILITAFVLSLLFPASQAMAQAKRPVLTGNVAADIAAAKQQSKAAETDQPAADPAAALPCMDITMLKKLTLQNLQPTLRACVQDANNQLVNDTQRALDSATQYAPTGSKAAIGDNDAINCLTPALALFKAGAIVAGTDVVLNADGSVKMPAVVEQKPGPILLAQKYREFTLAGGLSSCQTWINGPINATISAAGQAAGSGVALGAAALAVVPK